MAAEQPRVAVIMRAGEQLAGKIRKGWHGPRTDAGLPTSVTPPVLRHTAGTWLAQGGIRARDVANYLGMSEEVFVRTSYSGHPDHQRGIGSAFDAAKRSGASKH